MSPSPMTRAGSSLGVSLAAAAAYPQSEPPRIWTEAAVDRSATRSPIVKAARLAPAVARAEREPAEAMADVAARGRR